MASSLLSDCESLCSAALCLETAGLTVQFLCRTSITVTQSRGSWLRSNSTLSSRTCVTLWVERARLMLNELGDQHTRGNCLEKLIPEPIPQKGKGGQLQTFSVRIWQQKLVNSMCRKMPSCQIELDPFYPSRPVFALYGRPTQLQWLQRMYFSSSN